MKTYTKEELAEILRLHKAWYLGTGETDAERANLQYANLQGAYLQYADLRGADLQYADLRGANLSWSSHDLLAEILKRAAENDVEKRKIAGLILISKDWCWEQFLALDDPLRDWAISVLREYITEGDNHPAILDTPTKKEGE